MKIFGPAPLWRGNPDVFQKFRCHLKDFRCWRFDSPTPNRLSRFLQLQNPALRMSENENPTPSPSKQTSSIPLKKETVRVTLKAADAPPASPSAAIPPSAPTVRPPTPTMPPTPSGPPTPTARPTPTVGGAPIAGGAPTVGAPRPAPAPTIPLKTTGAPPAAPKPAPTIRLNTAPGAPAAPGAVGLPGAPTRPGLPTAPAGGATVALPKATVQLQPPTSPLTAGGLPSQGAATLSVSQDEEEEGQESGLVNILSIVGFAAALVVLYLQISTANTWIQAEDNPNKDSWFSALTAEPGA